MRNTAVKLIKLLFFIYITLYLLIWALSPYIARYFIDDALMPYKLSMSDSATVRFNPFISNLQISDVTLTKIDSPEEAVLSLNRFEMELHTHQIVFDTVYLSEFLVDGLFIKAKTLGELVEVAGVVVAGQASEAKAEQTVADDNAVDTDGSAVANEPVDYQLHLPNFALINSIIEVTIDGAPHEVMLSSLEVNDAIASMQAQSLTLSLNSEIDQANLAVDINVDLTNDNGQTLGTIAADLVLEKLELHKFAHFLPENISKFDGQVSVSAKSQLTLDANTQQVTISELTITQENLSLAYDDYHATLQQASLTGNDLSLIFAPEQAPKHQGQLNINLEQLASFYQNEQNSLAVIEGINLADINVSSEDDGHVNAAIASFVIENANFSQDITSDIPALAKFSQLAVNNILVNEHALAIDTIELAGIVADARIDAEQNLISLVDFAPNAENVATDKSSDNQDVEQGQLASEQTTVETQDPNTKSAMAISIKSIKFVDDAVISFSDQSVQPAYVRTLTLNDFTVGAINSDTPEVATPYSIAGKSNEYASLAFNGELKPFLANPSYRLKGHFKEVSLPSVSAYIKDALQYEIESGQLDLGLDVVLNGQQLDGNADVLLRGIELKAADSHEAGNLKDSTSVPFNIALGMLKDSDGNVELSLPLDGDTSNPSFGFSGFMTLLVKQATMSAAKDYLMTTFVPYASVVSIAIAAGEYALKIRVNDMHYPATKAELQPEQQQFLSEFAVMMRDNESVQLKLCPVSSAKDVGLTHGEEVTDANTIEKLHDIANQRSAMFKEYMVKEQNIASARLLFCTPQIDSSKEGLPRLTFEVTN